MWRALAYSVLGRDEDALRDAGIGRSLGAADDAGGLGAILASAAERQGRYADASAHLMPLLPAAARATGAAAITTAYEAAENPAKRPAAVAALRHLASTLPLGDQEERRWRLLLRLNTIAGDLDEAYAVANRAVDDAARSGSTGSSWGVMWFPSMRPFRQDPRFHAFAERLHLVEYWRVYGPPDGCAFEEGTIACQ